jgi:acetyl esterase/lipase
MTRLKLLIFFITFLSFSVFAREEIRLWDRADVTQKEKWSKLTVFEAEKPAASGVSVIICPGGSYFWLDRNNEGYAVAKYLNTHGITAFVLQYRTARKGNHHPAMINDLECAMQIVKENAERFHINPDRVGAMGFSAGGHLVGTSAIYSTKALRPSFVAMIYPVVSMEDSIAHKKSRKSLLGKNYSPELAKRMSLEQNVPTDMLPVFLLQCKNDQTVDYRNAVAMDKALTEKNIKHQFTLLDGCGNKGHGFGIQSKAQVTGWIDEFLKWLKTI